MDLKKIAELIRDCVTVTVFTGAGISTGSGIPDFRGENGLYKTVKDKYNLPSGESLFDINYFDRDPRPFFSFSREMLGQSPQPTLCHRLLGRWEKEGKVARVITQNIDRLHQKGGTDNIFECHGTYERGRCRRCGTVFSYGEYGPEMEGGEIPRCSCGGVIKPDVVFFGENLPEEFYRLWDNPPVTDFLLVLGTSLNVRPASDLALKFLRGTTSLIVNRDPTDYDGLFSFVHHGELESFARYMADYFNYRL